MYRIVQWSYQTSLTLSHPIFTYPIQFDNSFFVMVFGDSSSNSRTIISINFRTQSKYDITKQMPIIIDFDGDHFYSIIIGY